MSRVLRCVVAVYALVAVQPDLPARDAPLAAGNVVQCTLDEPDLSSRTVKVGDPIVCYARPAYILGCSLFPAGSQWAGRFEAYKNPGHFVGKGWIWLDFDRLILPNGIAPIKVRVISVSGFKVDAEGRIQGHPRRDEAEWAIPFLWPEKLVTLPLRGPRPALKGERTITLRLLDDVRLPCGGTVTNWPEGEWRHFGSSLHDSPQLRPFDSFSSVLIPFASTSRPMAKSSPPDRSDPGPGAPDGTRLYSAAQSPYTGASGAVVPVAQRSLRVRSSWPPQPGPQASRSPSSLQGEQGDPQD
jgi:hypothetical protein